MTYKKINLIVDKFVLKESISILDEFYKDLKEGKDFRYLNFGHYYGCKTNYNRVIKIRMDFLNDNAENKALDILRKLKITNFPLQNWEEKIQKNEIIKKAITLSGKCAIPLSKLDWFIDVDENNLPPDGNFLRGFFYTLFKRMDIEIRFPQKYIRRFSVNDDLKRKIDVSVDKIIDLCKKNSSYFVNPESCEYFFERFIHLLCNGLLYLKHDYDRFRYDPEDYEFWGIFCRIYSKTEKIDAVKLFCKEISDIKKS